MTDWTAIAITTLKCASTVFIVAMIFGNLNRWIESLIDTLDKYIEDKL